MSAPDRGLTSPHADELPSGEEAPPRGVRLMAIVRWLLVLTMALLAVYTATRELRSHEATETVRYHCPMHPTVVQDMPGSCPICGMTLVPLDESAGHASDGNTRAQAAAAATVQEYYCPMHPEVVSSDPNATCAKCGGMKLTPRPIPTTRAEAPTAAATVRTLAPEITLLGTTAIDPSAQAQVHVRVPAFVKSVLIASTGARVGRGQVLAMLYSQELEAATRDLFNARGLGQSGGAQLAAAARQRLGSLGLAEIDIEKLDDTGAVPKEWPLRAPRAGVVTAMATTLGAYVEPALTLFEITDLSELRVVADVPERWAPYVHTGAKVAVRFPSARGDELVSQVDLVYPAAGESGRALRVRIPLPGLGQQLSLGLTADVRIILPERAVLTVPRTAVLYTGESAHVLIPLADGGLSSRDVESGQVDREWLEIRSGLAEGEVVLAAPSFLVDSETRVRSLVDRHAEEP